ncbi:MAG: metal/formaldehyde-sensitive transcriptional repressor [Ramlibacter sp.]|nr:metal/formaldehyde-sensitive transcriptional repressor [Ramlibacter sp.]
MAHTIREKKKLLARVRRIRGQVEAIERALAEEAECERIMHMIAGIPRGVAGLMAEVVEDQSAPTSSIRRKTQAHSMPTPRTNSSKWSTPI